MNQAEALLEKLRIASRENNPVELTAQEAGIVLATIAFLEIEYKRSRGENRAFYNVIANGHQCAMIHTASVFMTLHRYVEELKKGPYRFNFDHLFSEPDECEGCRAAARA